jgi:hypothetical protein
MIEAAYDRRKRNARAAPASQTMSPMTTRPTSQASTTRLIAPSSPSRTTYDLRRGSPADTPRSLAQWRRSARSLGGVGAPFMAQVASITQ